MRGRWRVVNVTRLWTYDNRAARQVALTVGIGRSYNPPLFFAERGLTPLRRNKLRAGGVPLAGQSHVRPIKGRSVCYCATAIGQHAEAPARTPRQAAIGVRALCLPSRGLSFCVS